MNIIDTIKVERHLIRWNDGAEGEEFYARFGILETEEQDLALNEGLESRDEEWISFDENVFYWLARYQGEELSEHYPTNNPRMDFFIIPESELANG